MDKTMRIVLADDQVSVRSALRLLLEEEPGLNVVAEAADATGLLLAVADNEPDLVLLDWELPGLPPTQLLRLLRFERPKLKIIALSGRPESTLAARDADIQGFVSKNEPAQRVLCSVRAMM